MSFGLDKVDTSEYLKMDTHYTIITKKLKKNMSVGYDSFKIILSSTAPKSIEATAPWGNRVYFISTWHIVSNLPFAFMHIYL